MAHTQLGKEVKVILPESARELTIEQYQKFLKVEGDETFTMLKALEIFAHIPLKLYLLCPNGCHGRGNGVRSVW